MHPDVAQQEFERCKAEHPELQKPLDVYAAILRVQKDLKRRIAPALECDAPRAMAKLRAGKPVLEGEALPVDPDLFRQGLASVVAVLQSDGGIRLDAEDLLEADGLRPEKLSTLAASMAKGSVTALEEIAKGAEIEESILAFLLRSVFVPFYEAEAGRFRGRVGELWRRGTCPFCGSEPRMAKMDPEGQRSLYCSLCRTEWPFDRLACPYCGQSDHGSLRYLTMEGDRGHRADVCGICRRYIKACDERALGRHVVLDIEDIATLSLASMAEEEGYS